MAETPRLRPRLLSSYQMGNLRATWCRRPHSSKRWAWSYSPWAFATPSMFGFFLFFPTKKKIATNNNPFNSFFFVFTACILSKKKCHFPGGRSYTPWPVSRWKATSSLLNISTMPSMACIPHCPPSLSAAPHLKVGDLRNNCTCHSYGHRV